MKRIIISCLLCLLGASYSWAQTDNNFKFLLFLCGPGGLTDRLTCPGDYTAAEVAQFSVDVTFNGKTINFPAGSFMALPAPTYFVCVSMDMQKFTNNGAGTIPMGASVDVVVHTPGRDVSGSVTRNQFNASQNCAIDMTPPVTLPSLSVNGSICAGLAGSSATITVIDPPADLATNYTIKVVNGSGSAVAGFTISPLGVTMTVTAATGVAAGTYTVKLVENGTGKEYSASLTVGSAPALTIDPGASNTDGANGYFCKNGSDKLSLNLEAKLNPAGGGYTCEWTKPDGSKVGTTKLTGVNVTGNYSVTATSAAGCPVTAQITVVDKEAPVAPVIETPAKIHICKDDGGSTTLQVNSPNAAYTYSWVGTDGTNTGKVSHSRVAATVAATTVYVTANDGKCASKQSTGMNLYGHQLALTLSPSGTQSVPSGSTPTVTATPNFTPSNGTVIDATSWNWTATGDGIATDNGSNIVTNPITQASGYKVYAKDQYGCEATSPETKFTVKAGSVWNINLADVSGCFNTTIPLVATITGTPPSPGYAWTSTDLTFTPANALSTTVTAAAPGTYKAKLTVTDANSVKKDVEVNVTIYGNPTLTDVKITSTKVCVGDQVDLEAVGGAASTTALGNYNNLTYVWGNATGLAADQTKATGTVAKTGTPPNTYKVKIKDGNGCFSGEKSVDLTGHSLAVTAKINTSATSIAIPFDTKATLSYTYTQTPVDAAGSILNQVWSGGAGIDGVNTNPTAQTNALQTPGRYTVEIEDNYHCKATDDIDYTISGGKLTVTASDAYVCVGSTTTPLSCTPSGGAGNENGMTFLWTSSDGLAFDDPTLKKPNVTTTRPGVYHASVEIRQAGQSAQSAEIVVTVGEQPKLAGIVIRQNGVNIATGANVLPNSIVEAVVTPTYLPAGTVYTWSSTPADKIAGVSADHMIATSKQLATGSTCFELVVTNADNKCPDRQQACVLATGTEFVVSMPDKTICAGMSTAIVASEATNVTGGVKPYVDYTWSCTDPNFHFTVAADKKGITVDNNTAPGIYTVKLEVKDTKGNIASDEFDITVEAVPSFASVTPASPHTTRVGCTVNLSATATPSAAVMTWTGSPVTGAQTGTTGTASVVAGTFTAANTYTYTIEAKIGACRVDSTVTIKVIEKIPDITFNLPDVDICENAGGTIKIEDLKGGSGRYGFIWSVESGDIVLGNKTDQNPTIISASQGTHRLKVVVSDNTATDPVASVTKYVSVTITANPVINAINVDNITTGASGTTVAYGDELKLTAVVSPVSAGCSWTETGTSLVSPNGKEVFTRPMTATTTYTATASVTTTTGNTCKATKEVTVIVEKPVSGAVLELELDRKCADSGESMILKMKATGASTYSFTLKNNKGLSQNFTGAGPWQYSINLNDQDTYFVQNFKAFKNGLEVNPTQVNPSQIEALFYTTPVIDIANGNVQTVCKGDALTLTANSQLGNTKYEWNNGIKNGEAFYPQASGKYTVTATSDKGCKATSDVNVTIIPKPTVTINAQPNTICLGETVRLTAGGSASEFIWNNGQTGPTVTDIPNVGGTVKYVVTGKELVNGCSDTASTTVIVNEPPKIISTSKTVRSIAIGKGVSFSVKATGKNLTYEWQRWTGSSWLTLYDAPSDQPTIKGAHSDSLILGDVPRSWNGTKLQCIVTNSCGVADTTFLLNVKECFDIADIEWDMCEGIRPETDPTVAIDGWYCPGTRIAVCARLVFEDPDVDVTSAVYKWTVDGLNTDDGRWGEMKFLSDSSILSWIPPVEWQDNITIALCAYVDGACDTVCKRYLRLKATKYSDLAWKLRTSVDPTRKFCPGDTVTCWIEDENKTAGLNPTYKWYNDVFDLQEGSAPYNPVVSLQNDKVVLAMGQQNTWMKVVMTPSPEICTRKPQYTDTAFLEVKKVVTPSLRIECADTLACKGDEIFMKAIFENGGKNPAFQWQRSIGDPFPDWNLGTESTAKVKLDEDDVWVKCTMKPSDDVCYDKTKPVVDALKIKVLQEQGEVTIACDMADKQPGDELIFTSEVKHILGDYKYEWMVNERLAPEDEAEFISSDFRQGDVVYCMVSGERVCQNRIKSNEITVKYGRISRDTMITIYRNDRVLNMSMFKPGDESNLFVIADYPHNGKAIMTLLGGLFTYVPNRDFVGVDVIRYLVKDKFNPKKVEEGYIYINVLENGLDNLPNIITPNGDGMNDEWHLETVTDKYTNYEITIYDRTGNVVFHCKNNYANDWNGQGLNPNYQMPRGVLPSGIYTYVIKVEGEKKLMSWLEIRADLNRSSYR